MRRIYVGLGLGAVAGLLDVTPMIAMKLPWDADLSAFCLWTVSGLFVSTVDWKIPAIAKGIAVPSLILLPSAVLIGAQEPGSLVPIAIMTLVLGALLGWSVSRLNARATP